MQEKRKKKFEVRHRSVQCLSLLYLLIKYISTFQISSQTQQQRLFKCLGEVYSQENMLSCKRLKEYLRNLKFLFYFKVARELAHNGLS